MAKLTPKKFNINTFNVSGEEYTNGNAPTPQDFNALASGIQYLNENMVDVNPLDEMFPRDTWSVGTFTSMLMGTPIEISYYYKTDNTDPKNIPFAKDFDVSGVTMSTSNLVEFYVMAIIFGYMGETTEESYDILLNNPVAPITFTVFYGTDNWRCDLQTGFFPPSSSIKNSLIYHVSHIDSVDKFVVPIRIYSEGWQYDKLVFTHRFSERARIDDYGKITTNGIHNVRGSAEVKVDVKPQGTVVPIGERIDNIYFNTSLSYEEVCSHLSKLSYSPFEGRDIYIVYGYNLQDSTYDAAVIVGRYQVEGEYHYSIIFCYDLTNFRYFNILSKSNVYTEVWGIQLTEIDDNNINYQDRYVGINKIEIHYPSINEFNGMPVGQQNELIKNVISSTPF